MAATSTRVDSTRDARALADALAESRARSLAILDPLPATAQERQVSEIMSPLCWDLAHIGHYEELWLVRELTHAPPTDAHFDDVYDAFKHPRRERSTLDILDAAGARQFVASVRARALDVLAGIPAGALAPDADDPLLAGGFVHGMVVQHEHQHDETMLATIQLMDDFEHPAADGRATQPLGAPHAQPGSPQPGSPLALDVLVDGGPFTMGTDDDAWAYDNERPAHEVTLASYRIDTTPVTNRAYAEFVGAGGYDDARLWTPAGWAWRAQSGSIAPGFWARDGAGGWVRTRFGRTEPVPPDEPVQHVCWYEADAFARWSGSRLPTEAEWERAALGADVQDANLWPPGSSPHRWAPAPVGTRHDVSDVGAVAMLGDVWEWTASDFGGYPGFASFPYREYSEVFFGDGYKVLRGGSWATHRSAVRVTFRNWDFPIRRQIFSGFRCARRLTVCRHLAHLGPSAPLHDLLFGAPHALARQARSPAHMDSGDDNPDGWGVGWYAEGRAEPERYRTVTPIWEDTGFAERSEGIETGAFLAAARLASPGAAIDPTGNAPFRSGSWLFSLNGIVHGFHDGMGHSLRSQVTPTRRADIEGDTDSEVLFAMTLDRLDAGEAPDDALAAVVHDVLAVTTGRVNLLLTDGSLIAATRSGRSLFVRGSTVASEPLDADPAWREVADAGVVLVPSAGAEAVVRVATP